MRTIREIQGDMSYELMLLYCSSDLKFWGEKVLGLDIQPFHLRWLNLIKNNNRVAIQAFTGSGKTEVCIIGFPLWYLFHNRNKEILIVSTTLRQSLSVLERIKKAIEENELLLKMVDTKLLSSGDWCARSQSGAHITLTEGRKIYCAPCSENVRGYHVDIVLADEVSAYKDPSIFRNYVSTRVGAKGRDGKLIAISTSKSPTDLLQELINSPVYKSDTVLIMEKDGTLNWPGRFGIDYIEMRKSELGLAGFEREYLCNPKAEVEGAVFTAKCVMSCTDISLMYRSPTVDGTIFIGADFAVSNGPRADFDVYFVVEKAGGKAIIRDVFRGKGVPKDEKVRILKGLCDMYNPYRVILDMSGIGKAVSEDLFRIGYAVEDFSFKPSNRRDILVVLISMVQSTKLVIPYNRNDDERYEISKTLIEEMLSFKEEKSLSTNMLTYKSTSPHDDCVMALALACKGIAELEDYEGVTAVA